MARRMNNPNIPWKMYRIMISGGISDEYYVKAPNKTIARSMAMSFVQLQKVLPTPAVSFLSAPEETLSFLLNTKCHLLLAWSYWLLRANIVLVSRFGFGFGFGLDYGHICCHLLSNVRRT